MRIADRGERERAAFELATAYASPSPARTATSSGGWATCRRPMSARSTASNRHMATGGGAYPARSRRGWVGEVDEQLSLGLDFRRRRAALMSRPRGPACETRGSGAVNDLEALEDQNQRLKVALSRLVEENKRYRVNKARLEGELLRADAKVEILLSELEQAPGKRDQRLLNAARMEVEKCAVVRSLAKQKEHLQKMLARQERELDAMKQTKEWSAVVEMTAATEEYFLEIRRLQRLLAQQQQGTSANSPVAGVSDGEGGAMREAYVPNQRDQTQRRSSGVDDTVWIHRPETCDVSMSFSSPVDGLQDNQRILDATSTSGGGDVYNVVHRPTSAPAVQANEFHVVHQEDSEALLHELEVPAFRRRPASPKRRVSPPRRARMATRSGRETVGDGIHKKVSEEPRVSRQTTQVARGALGRKQRGGSQSQVWIRAAEARRSASGVDARRSTVGVRSRPLSAPRTKRELKMTSTGNARRADSLSPFDKGRRQSASYDRGAAAGSGAGHSAACVRQKTTPRSSSSSRAPADHRIPTVSVPTEPRTWETGEKRRPKARSHSASPRSSSSRNRTGAGDAFRAQGETTIRTANASVTEHQTMGRKVDNDDGNNNGEGGSGAGLPGVAVAPRSSQSVEDELEFPPLCDDDGTSDDVYYDGAKRRLSSSVPSSKLLAAAASVEHPLATVAKECEEGITATAQGQEGDKEQTADGSTLGPAGSGDAENTSKDKESRAVEGDELARNLTASGPSSWGSFEAADEPPKNEAKKGNTEEGSVTPVSSATSTDADARENPNGDVMTGENSTTSTSNKSDDLQEQLVTAAEKPGALPSDASPRSGSNGSPNDGDRNIPSPLPEVGDDNTIARSVSSHAVTEEDHKEEQEVDAELEADKLLFDIEGDRDSVGDDPLVGENQAAPSEYGDDFDDFEDEED